MKEQYKIFDCTLRDGGYYTSWDFDRELVKSNRDYQKDLVRKGKHWTQKESFSDNVKKGMLVGKNRNFSDVERYNLSLRMTLNNPMKSNTVKKARVKTKMYNVLKKQETALQELGFSLYDWDKGKSSFKVKFPKTPFLSYKTYLKWVGI